MHEVFPLFGKQSSTSPPIPPKKKDCGFPRTGTLLHLRHLRDRLIHCHIHYYRYKFHRRPLHCRSRVSAAGPTVGGHGGTLGRQ